MRLNLEIVDRELEQAMLYAELYNLTGKKMSIIIP